MRHLMWLPAALLLSAGVLAAGGFKLVGPSYGASTGSTAVDVTVLPNLTFGGTCDGATRSGSLSVAADDSNIGATCTVTYSTNNHAAGVRLRAESTRALAPALCKQANTTLNCGAVDSFGDAATGGIVDMADGAFGVQVAGAPTCTTGAGSWVNGTSYGLPAGAGAGSVVCAQHNMGAAGTYTLQFRADTLAAQPSGDYDAGVSFFLEAV
jgi:hypothetical protein